MKDYGFKKIKRVLATRNKKQEDWNVYPPAVIVISIVLFCLYISALFIKILAR